MSEPFVLYTIKYVQIKSDQRSEKSTSWLITLRTVQCMNVRLFFNSPDIEDRGAHCFCPVFRSVIPLFCNSV